MRSFVRAGVVFGWCFLFGGQAASAQPFQATGVKVGEVTENSAIVWVRLTERAERNPGDPGKLTKQHPGDEASVHALPGECPGSAGQVRLTYGTQEDVSGAITTAWASVSAEADFTHSFTLTGLEPDTRYFYETACRSGDSEQGGRSLQGSFRTAPRRDQPRPVTFTVITGQCYTNMDDAAGFKIYDAMGALEPDFIVPTGDTVYYDHDLPFATSVALARYHWHRTYSLPRLVAFHLRVPGYWEKDDHDTLVNDCWPSMVAPGAGSLTFEQGCRVFREQVPMSEKTYRTFRWGRSLQVWLVEGRDFRSPNDMPDGLGKTIWGADQIKWLKETLQASDADWKVLISPTPLVGPDRGNKADNHANRAFAHEGAAFRNWATENLNGRFFAACGDRHWQYHSVDPKTGLQEFSCGPTTDKHASGSPGEDPEYHRFHRVKGGFLSAAVTPSKDTGGEDPSSKIEFRFHDVTGKVVYRHEESR